MRFLHCADIHLDSPLKGLARYEGVPEEAVRAAPRRAFKKLVRYAIDEAVDFLVIAGDLYDGDWPDFNTGLFFARQMGLLAEAGIPVFLLRGNHDAESQITRSLRLPDNVLQFRTDEPQTFTLEHLGVALHGQGFAQRDVSTDLAAGYPQAVPDMFNIGVLHTALSGRPGHAPYAPTSVSVLAGRCYGYWALGHVHAREVVHTDPHIVFPGNLQGRHIRETGAKGAELVTVLDGQLHTQPVAFDVLRWQHLEVDIAAIEDDEALLAEVASRLGEARGEHGDRALAVRLSLAGRTPLHARLSNGNAAFEAELRRVATEASAGLAWLEKVRFRTRAPIDRAALAAGDDPLAELLRSLDGLRGDTSGLQAIAHEVMQGLTARLAGVQSADEPGLAEESSLAALLDEVETLLLEGLAGEGTGE
jgi:DNA repair protein SbcD/Mre11